MKTLLTIFFILFFSSPALATLQIPDEIQYEGERYVMRDFPLDVYIKENEVDMLAHVEAMCSANWRGYLGLWLVEDGKLFLTGLLSDACRERKPMPLTLVFPEAKDRVRADWFSGTLNLYEFGQGLFGKEALRTLKFVKGELQE